MRVRPRSRRRPRLSPRGDLPDPVARQRIGRVRRHELEGSLANVEERKLRQAEQRAPRPCGERLRSVQGRKEETDGGRSKAGSEVQGPIERTQRPRVIGEEEEERIVGG